MAIWVDAYATASSVEVVSTNKRATSSMIGQRRTYNERRKEENWAVGGIGWDRCGCCIREETGVAASSKSCEEDIVGTDVNEDCRNCRK